MLDSIIFLLPVLFLILVAEFVNGWNDAPNAIATVVSTRVLSPLQAVIMAMALNTVGAMSGTAVAVTIGKGIVRPEAISVLTLAAAMVGVIIWGAAATLAGLPISLTHALVSSLAGAGFATAGSEVLLWDGWGKVLAGLGFSTFLGFLGGFLLMMLIYWTLRRVRPGTVRKVFGRLQIFSSAFIAFSHGSNDGQKFIGAFSLALFIGGVMDEFRIPIWVILTCALVMGLGTATGGWRVVKTMGMRLTKVESVQGFAAECSASLMITIASHFGIPLSTTHTINTSIMGVGATRKFSAVRWGVGGEILSAWLLTFPVCALLGWGTCKIFQVIF